MVHYKGDLDYYKAGIGLRILFFTPISGRAPDIEAAMKGLIENGHTVFSLNINSGDQFHPIIESFGTKVHKAPFQVGIGLIDIFLRFLSLTIFCYRHKITLVYSHLETCNPIAVMSDFFTRSKTVIVRHHVDEMHLLNKENSFLYRFSYKHARNIAAVSQRACQFMIDRENVPESKIHFLKLGFDFTTFNIPKLINRQKKNGSIQLLSVARLIPIKRIEMSIRLVKLLLQSEINVHLTILGKGPEKQNLEKLTRDLAVESNVTFQGHVPNVLEYMARSHILYHPSILDSSSITIKEAGLTRLPVIVCKGVGDFEDYIKHGENGFLVSKENPIVESIPLIADMYHHTDKYLEIGSNLESIIRKEFSIENVINDYEDLQNSLING